jgi:hypothetical protein
MSEETMTQFKTEGQPLFEKENNENDSSDSSSEKTNIDQSGSSDQNKDSDANKDGDKSTNFADHPRWKQREDDWTKRFNEQEKRHIDELAKFRQEIDSKFSASQKGKTEENVEIPKWFGGDEEQWQEYQKWNKTLVSQAKEEALNEINSKSESEKKAIDEATTYFQDQVVLLETDKSINPQGEKVDRNKLLKFVEENDLVDSKGRWNYRAAYQMMKGSTSSKQSNLDEKKKIASATTSDTKSETKNAGFSTSADFSKPGSRPW